MGSDAPFRFDVNRLAPISFVLLLLLPGPASAQDLHRQLIEAAMRGDVAQLKTVLAAGEKPDETDASKRTALIYASAQGSVPAVQLLLDAGASPSARDMDGVS